MAEKHVFTADEIRAATNRLEEFGVLNGVYVVVGNSLQGWDVTGDDILAMLRQFADEKAENAKLNARLNEVAEYAKRNTWREDANSQGVATNTCAKVHNIDMREIAGISSGERKKEA